MGGRDMVEVEAEEGFMSSFFFLFSFKRTSVKRIVVFIATVEITLD